MRFGPAFPDTLTDAPAPCTGADMKRISLGVLLVLHGLAHSAAGTWASAMSHQWLSTSLWLVATLAFLAAGFGLLGVAPLAIRWRGLTAAGSAASLGLLTIYGTPALIPGILLDAALFWIALRVPVAAPPRGVVRHPVRRALSIAGQGFALAFLAYVGVVLAARPWYTTWGSTRAERSAPVPGDNLGAQAHYRMDNAVTIDAPADSVWPWLVQLGQDRAGFYSYDKLERFFGDQVTNVDSIVPEWQHREVGDLVHAAQPGYLGGVFGRQIGWRVSEIEPNRHMVLEGWGAFILEPVDASTSRLLVRSRGDGYPSTFATVFAPVGLLIFEPAHFVMQRRMLLGIKERAEARRVTAAPTDYLGAR